MSDFTGIVGDSTHVPVLTVSNGKITAAGNTSIAFPDPPAPPTPGSDSIVFLTAPETPTGVIPRLSGWTVAVVTATSGDPPIFLPSDAEIGDVVEVHLRPALNTVLHVVAQSPETVDDGAVSRLNGRIFRKVSATLWVAVGSP